MTKNNKGFFLAETIIVISLITTVMVFVFPNLSKLYDNFKNRAEIYDRVDDLYELKAIYDKYKDSANENSIDSCSDDLETTSMFDSNGIELSDLYITDLYITKYMSNPSKDNNYNFNKYLHRMKKTSDDEEACRLIGVFKHDEKETYASIKIYPLEEGGGYND